MDINLELYRIFCEVARKQSFSGAARALFISQPAVSQAVKQLERQLDVPLFIRGPRGVALTREGEILRGYADSALNLLEAGQARISALKSLTAGELRIGASDTMSRRFLMPAIGRFHAAHPDVALRITNRTSPETIALLREGKLDVGFVNLPISVSGVSFEECKTVHDIFVAGCEYEHLRGKPLTPRDLAAQHLIMLEQASNSRRWVDRHFLSCGVPLRPDIELGAHDLLLDYAVIGLGVACVIEEFSLEPIENGRLFKLELTPPVPQRSIGACWLSGIELSTAARRFITLVKEAKER